jgi:hypothetical protein
MPTRFQESAMIDNIVKGFRDRTSGVMAARGSDSKGGIFRDNDTQGGITRAIGSQGGISDGIDTCGGIWRADT